MAKTAKAKLIKQLALAVVIGLMLRFVMTKLRWHLPSLENRLIPALVLWMLFGLYWGTAALNSAPTKSSESWVSTFFHQFMLGAALLLLILPVPGLTGWFLPGRLHFFVAAGAIVQAGFFLLAVWARRHLGRNWSAEVRIAVDHPIGPHWPVWLPPASRLYRNVGHVLGNGDSLQPIPRADWTGDIGGSLPSKNPFGRTGPAPDVWG